MANVTYEVVKGVVGGTGDGSSLANAYPDLLTAFTARATTVNAPDTITFNCSGDEDEVAGAVSIKMTDLGWAGDGEIILQGNLLSNTKIDGTKYSWKLSNVGKPFYVDNAPNIRLKNFHLHSPRGGDAYMFYALSTAAMPSIYVEDSILQTNNAFDQNLSIVRAGSVEPFAAGVSFTFTDTTILGYVGSVVYANYSSGCVSTFTRCTMKTGKFISVTDGGTHTAIDCAIDKTGDRDYFTGTPTITNCATSDGIGTNPVTIADWGLQFIDRTNGDVTLSQSSSLFGEGSTGNNVGSDQFTTSTNISAFTSVNSGGIILQTAQDIVLVFQDYTDPVTVFTIDGIDHSDLLENVTTTGATFQYMRRISTVAETKSVSIVLGDGTISRAIVQDVTTTHPIAAAYGLVDSNSVLAGVKVTNADAAFRVTTEPTHGSLDWTLPSSNDIDTIYTPVFGYTGSDFFVIEVYDPATDATNSGQIDLTVSADTTKPSFLVGPNTSSIADTSFSVSLTSSETGTYRIVLLEDGSTAPTAGEVRAGTGSAGATPLYDSAFQSMTASTPLILPVTGLIEGTAYDMYVVLVDATSNDFLSPKVDISTTGTTPVDITPPGFTVAPVVSLETISSGRVSFTPDEDGAFRAIFIPNLSGSEPNVDQVLAGTDALGASVAISTPLTVMVAGEPYNLDFTNLDDNIPYSVYVALIDSVNLKTLSTVAVLTTLEDTSSPATAKFTGVLKDWDTDALAASVTGLQITATATFGGDVIDSPITFSTDASGAFSVEYPGVDIGTVYFCAITNSDTSITELHKITAEVK